MKRPSFAVSFWLAIVILSSCPKNEINSVSDSNQTVSDSNHVKTVQWRLTAFDTLGGGTMNLNPADTIFLFFEETRVARGRSYGLCGNYYECVYILEGGTLIRFDSLRSTEAVCPSSRYWDYFHALEKVNSFQVDTSRLCLYYNGTTQRLVLEKIR